MRHLLLGLATLAAMVLTQKPARAQTDEGLIARGRYIATAIQGCGCHTREKADGGKDEAWHYAGAPNPPPPAGPPANAGWTSPRWKRIYARNITPDRETGIGNWTDEQIKTMLLTGNIVRSSHSTPGACRCGRGDFHAPPAG